MESRSPIKEWIQKHSPSKSRNKPLPPPPTQSESPVKREVKPISGNVQHKKSINKFRSLLKQKDHKQSPPPQQPQSRDQPDPRLLSKSSPIQRRISKTKPVDLENLSKKVSNLEAQLREARRELDRALTPIPFGDDDEAQEKRQRRTDTREKYDGLVESLLKQRDETYQALKVHSSADLGKTYGQYEPQEDSREPVSRDRITQDLHHKRKRSELREATWKQIQDHVEAEARQQQKSTIRSLNSRHSYSTSDELPPARRQKQHHHKQLPASPLQDALTPSPPHHLPEPEKRHTRSFSAPLEIETESVQNTHQARPSLPRQRSASHDRTTERAEQAVRRHSHVFVRNYENYDVDEPEEGDSEENCEIDAAFARHAGGSRPPSPARRHVPSPVRLRPVKEEYEWDEDIF